MPSIFRPFAGLSCLSCSAIDIDVTDAAAGSEMIQALAESSAILNTKTLLSTDHDSSSSSSSSSNTGSDDEDDAPLLLPSQETQKTTSDDKSVRSHRSIYTATSRRRVNNNDTSHHRRASMRSILSRHDSCRTIQSSAMSVRSIPFYMKHALFFWNGNDDDEEKEKSTPNGSTSGEDRHSSSLSDSSPSTSSSHQYQDLDDIDHDEVITCTLNENCYDDYPDVALEYDNNIIISSKGGDSTTCSSSSNSDNDTAEVETKEEEIIFSDTSFHLSSLLGPNLVRFQRHDDGTTVKDTTTTTTTTTVHATDVALNNSALIGLYYAKGNECQQTTEYIRLFTAGYYHPILDVVVDNTNNNDTENDPNELQGLSIVFCDANEDISDDTMMMVPPNLPSEWYTLPVSSTTTTYDIQRQNIRKELDIVTTAGPTLVIFDPHSGQIVCSNAILDILQLNRNNDVQYDKDAVQLYDSWIQQLSTTTQLEQFHVSNDDKNDDTGIVVTMEYMDGERTNYERLLPYSI